MRESQIVHESGSFWVSNEGHGLFKVWENVGWHSERRGTYHFKLRPDHARNMAICDCKRRAAEQAAKSTV